MRIETWIKKNTKSLRTRRVVVSGSTGGIGMALCHHLASLGADLILLDRNPEKSRALADRLVADYKIDVRCVIADMTDMASVKAAGEELASLGVDYLVLNAGAYSIPREILKTGYDNVFQINFVSPYYLARRLLPSIRARGGRIIAVGSIAHNYSEIDEGDIDFRKRSRASLVYGNAKRYLTFALQNLSMGDVIIAHPGISFTGITNHYPKLIFALIKHPMKLIFMKPRKACLSILYGIFADAPSGYWIGPRIFDVWGLPSVKRLRTAGSEEKSKIIKISERIFGEIE
jgi:NAD(P)-dependent dehydrogenase (short-subunit alcohol dehydrogenase family)